MLHDHPRSATASAEALHSPCGLHRLTLLHRWGAADLLGWVMLNPSTATETQDDPTVARCRRRARDMGCGGFVITNLFTWRSPSPAELKRAAAPLCHGADDAMLKALAGCDRVICAWGNHGTYRNRAAEVRALLSAAGLPLWHLGLTRLGQPRHPLYTRHDAPLWPLV